MTCAKQTSRLRGLLFSVPALLCSASALAAGHQCSLSLTAGQAPVTGVLQQAIDRCSTQGGGTVTLPAGVWVSGPLMLKSHVTLHLAAGSRLTSTGNPADFTAAFISKPLQPREALIIATHVRDVAITGPGTVDGQGQHGWWPMATDARNHLKRGNTQWFARHWKDVPPANGMPRPWLIEFDHVRDGKLQNVNVINSPMWNVVLRDSRNILMSHSTVTNPPDSPNTDGVDVVSSQNVLLRDLTLSTGDDDISVKSGLATTGKAPASRDITIEDCNIGNGHGISVGSETANGIGAITVRNIRFRGTANGIRVKSGRDRGSEIGPLSAENIVMTGVNVPLVITDSYGGNGGYSRQSLSAISPEPVSRYTPFIHDISVNHLKASGAGMAGMISGLPEAPLKNITLKNIAISSVLGMQSRYANGTLHNVKITSVQHPLALQQGPGSHWNKS